ncbi:MAG TPA: alpha/beta fold hydrolase [Gemmataceae bacterium]|nr:alpha/beta fold hydrolase [Gemmataceae bacterium]
MPRTVLARSLPCFVLLLACTPPAGAHDLWLIPGENVAVGKPALVRANVGMDFPRSEHAPDTAAFKRRLLIQRDGSAGILKAAGKDGTSGLLEFVPATPGVYIVAVETQPRLLTLAAEKFNAYLVEDGMPHIYRLRAKEKTLDQPGRERYSKHVKSLVRVGAGGGGDPCRVVGLTLEIVPLRDPFTLKSGDALPVRVLFHGKPLADANVGWQSPGDGETARGYVRTDDRGEALVPVARAGLMTLRLTHMTRPKAADYEWESFWTTLTFRLEEASATQSPVAFGKKTYVFKTVGDTKIEADVYRHADTKVRPVLVWLHGGALILGSRTGVPKDLLDLCRTEGFALVSFDYRLAPEVKLPAIIADVEDALAWLHTKGPALLHIDPKRMVVAGGSAGGYLTLMTGLRAQPRPKALLAYWGYGDVDGDWYTKPSPFYRKIQPLIDKDEAYRAVGGKVLTGTDGSNSKGRGQFYRYLRQNGLWTKVVTGFDPATERDKLDRYCPVRNVTSDYPPTLLVHGTNDDDVPYELSAAMAKELARHKVTHELITVRGAGHGLSGGGRKEVADALERARAFVRQQLRAVSTGSGESR